VTAFLGRLLQVESDLIGTTGGMTMALEQLGTGNLDAAIDQLERAAALAMARLSAAADRVRAVLGIASAEMGRMTNEIAGAAVEGQQAGASTTTSAAASVVGAEGVAASDGARVEREAIALPVSDRSRVAPASSLRTAGGVEVEDAGAAERQQHANGAGPAAVEQVPGPSRLQAARQARTATTTMDGPTAALTPSDAAAGQRQLQTGTPRKTASRKSSRRGGG
jgi:hypothetical protein